MSGLWVEIIKLSTIANLPVRLFWKYPCYPGFIPALHFLAYQNKKNHIIAFAFISMHGISFSKYQKNGSILSRRKQLAFQEGNLMVNINLSGHLLKTVDQTWSCPQFWHSFGCLNIPFMISLHVDCLFSFKALLFSLNW